MEMAGGMLSPRAIVAVLLAALLLAALVIVPSVLLRAPQAKLWPRWRANDAADTRAIDHGPWQAFLATHLITDHPSGIHRIDYAKVGPAERGRLSGYLQDLRKISISGYNRGEQLPFWINLYNALTVQVVLRHYPVKSILKIGISPGWFNFGPWDAKLIHVEREPLSLNDIEHRILRPIWRDPRLHYSVNCASLGCPNLAHSAFTAQNTEALLDSMAREFINHPRGAAFADDELTVSKIYDWFQEDFGGSEAGVVKHLLLYAEGPLAARLKTYRGGLDFDYDWGINRP